MTDQHPSTERRRWERPAVARLATRAARNSPTPISPDGAGSFGS